MSQEKSLLRRVVPYMVIITLLLTLFYVANSRTIALECPYCHDTFLFRKPDITGIGASVSLINDCPICGVELLITTSNIGEVVVEERK